MILFKKFLYTFCVFIPIMFGAILPTMALCLTLVMSYWWLCAFIPFVILWAFCSYMILSRWDQTINYGIWD